MLQSYIAEMKLHLAALGSVLLTASAIGANILVKPHDFVALCGDSITYQQQYSVFIEDYLLMCQPVEGVQIDQFGSAGETAPGFVSRLSNEVLPFQPTFATLCYGMNDGGMNQANYNPTDTQTPEAFRKGETDVIHALKSAGVRNIVVGSPGCVDSHFFNHNGIRPDVYNGTLQKLTDVAREVAQSERLPFVEIHALMSNVMVRAKGAYGETYPMAQDGIHPSANGHLVMAYAFLKAMGCDGAIGTITVDLGTGTATGTAGHKIIAVHNGSVDVESSRYPFCFWGDPSKPDATDGVIRYFPFNKDLNRYLLVVRGLRTPKAKVTWGNESKEFTSSELAVGINLAEIFLTNPFLDKFTEVDKAVRLQQKKEASLVNLFMRNRDEIKGLVPDQSAVVDRLIEEAMDQDRRSAEAAQALVTPVRHTIQVEAVQ